jgi:MFS family permease
MILASAVNTKMLNPNFAIMCAPGAHPDSFPSTEPFGFNSATYFLPMCTLVGVAIASIFIGTLSDRYGRKSLLRILGWVSAVGSVVKYFTSDTFWGFCASNFAFGFFLGNLPVGRSDILYLCGITSFRTCSQLTFTFVLNC